MSKKYKSAKIYPNMANTQVFGFYRNEAEMSRRHLQWSMLNSLIQSKGDLDLTALGSLRQENYKFKDSITYLTLS